jgi:hypothetical protein
MLVRSQDRTAALLALLTDRAALRAHAQLWADHGPRDYELVIQRSTCECLPEWLVPIRLTVRDGQIHGVVHHETGDTITTPPYHAMTIEGLFAVIEDAINQYAHEVDVRYHGESGYPTSIFIDHHPDHVDDELVLDVLRLDAAR